MRRNTKWMIGSVVIIGAIVVLAMTELGQNVVYFYTPDEAMAKSAELSHQTIKLGGMVVPGSVKWEAESLSLVFKVSDLKGHDIDVTHKGTPPDMFKEGSGVVVQGRLASDGRSIVAQRLMVKHSEEYKKPGDHSQSIDKELLEKSMFQ